jgi:Erv1 / Alr family
MATDLRSPPVELAWLAQFANKVRCAGCRKHWREVTAKLPPDFSSPAAYFRWTVRAHNAINRRLGKPIMKLQTAKRLW